MKAWPWLLGAAALGGGVFVWSRTAQAAGPDNFHVVTSKVDLVPLATIDTAVLIVVDDAHWQDGLAAAAAEAEDHPDVQVVVGSRALAVELAADMGYFPGDETGEWGAVASATRDEGLLFVRMLSADRDAQTLLRSAIHDAVQALQSGIDAAPPSEVTDVGVLVSAMWPGLVRNAGCPSGYKVCGSSEPGDPPVCCPVSHPHGIQLKQVIGDKLVTLPKVIYDQESLGLAASPPPPPGFPRKLRNAGCPSGYKVCGSSEPGDPPVCCPSDTNRHMEIQPVEIKYDAWGNYVPTQQVPGLSATPPPSQPSISYPSGYTMFGHRGVAALPASGFPRKLR